MDHTASRLDGLADALRPFAGADAGGRYAAGLWADVSGELLYAEGGLAAVLVDRPADDAVARGWTCEGDETGVMADEWSRLDAAPVFADALRYAARDGAGAVLVLCQDRGDLAEPLDEARVGAVLALRPLSGAQLSGGPYRYGDPAHPRYGQPTTYRVRDIDGGGEYEVHETRLLRVPGDPMARTTHGGGGWAGHGGTGHASGSSLLPWAGRPRLAGQVGQDLRRYREALRWLVTLLERKQQPVHQAAGLAALLADADRERRAAQLSGLAPPVDDAYAIVRARARAVDMTRGILGTVMVDGDDKFSVLDLGLSGTGEVLREMKIALAASSRIPVSILFGESAKGLNATAEGDFEGYYGHISQIQNRSARPGLERLTSILFKQDGFRGREPPRWRIVFSPLWTISETAASEAAERRARARKAEAEALSTLADLGIATPEELRAAARAVLPEYGLDGDPLGGEGQDATDGDADDAVIAAGGGALARPRGRLPRGGTGVPAAAFGTADATATIAGDSGVARDGAAPAT